jgi:isopenicillin-N epimerase
VTSPTALRLPVERLVPALEARGIRVLVDGAHAPGQLALDIDALGATWYAGNHHKWLCAPKGSGFLALSERAPTAVRPVVTSHGASPEYGPANRLHAELDWMGTHDPTPHLCVPTALSAVAELGGGWPAVIARNHALVLELRDRTIAALGGDARHAIAGSDALGAMAAIPITLATGTTPITLQEQLLRDGWEVPIVEHHAGLFVRVSAQLYNHAAQGDQLGRELYARGARPRTL